MTIERFNDAICSCCGRAATGFGYSPDHKRPPLWVCDAIECLQIAKDSYSMKQDEFTRAESRAAQKGGEEGGEFLDGIGKSDLATLTIDEWCEFCRRVVAGYPQRAGCRDQGWSAVLVASPFQIGINVAKLIMLCGLGITTSGQRKAKSLITATQ
jgi:hypothetical protein